ncbi:MAG: GntR family transcriptional regulator [Actinomycetota bacterium]|nr:GntR family transcriptional regulator [Actinomycetota bacterium]
MSDDGRPTSSPTSRRGASLRQHLYEIVLGDAVPGQRIPSEQEFAKQFHVSRNSVREAVESLVAAGMLRREWGVGTFVTGTARAIASSLTELQPVSQLVRSQGHACEVLHGESALTKAVDVPFKPSVEPWSDEYWRMTRTYRVDGVPAIHIVDYVPTEVCGRVFDPTSVGDDLMPVLERDYGVAILYGTAVFGATMPSAEVQSDLDCPADEPVLLVSQLTCDHDERPVIFSDGFLKSDRFTYSVVRYRTKPGNA